MNCNPANSKHSHAVSAELIKSSSLGGRGGGGGGGGGGGRQFPPPPYARYGLVVHEVE